MGFYEISSPLVNFNIIESFQVRVNSLDYTRSEEQHGQRNNMESYEISAFF
jgi:hypothetical protein